MIPDAVEFLNLILDLSFLASTDELHLTVPLIFRINIVISPISVGLECRGGQISLHFFFELVKVDEELY
jgi:hypothetical protein